MTIIVNGVCSLILSLTPLFLCAGYCHRNPRRPAGARVLHDAQLYTWRRWRSQTGRLPDSLVPGGASLRTYLLPWKEMLQQQQQEERCQIARTLNSNWNAYNRNKNQKHNTTKNNDKNIIMGRSSEPSSQSHCFSTILFNGFSTKNIEFLWVVAYHRIVIYKYKVYYCSFIYLNCDRQKLHYSFVDCYSSSQNVCVARKWKWMYYYLKILYSIKWK